MSILKDQEALMVAFGQDVSGGSINQAEMYRTLVAEEAEEFREASDLKESVKEAVDVIVVASRFLISVLGEQDARRAWNAVLESNLAKVTGGVTTREDGKVLQNAHQIRILSSEVLF